MSKGDRVIRFAQSLCRRVATTLAVMAALAFVIDGALGGHLVPAASAHVGHFHVHAHNHAHAHSHGPVVSDHQFINGDVVADVDVATVRHGSSPTPGPDADGNCCTCACACSAAALQPALIAQAAPFLLISNMAFVHRRHGDGIVPEGLRRPPRTPSIA